MKTRLRTCVVCGRELWFRGSVHPDACERQRRFAELLVQYECYRLGYERLLKESKPAAGPLE